MNPKTELKLIRFAEQETKKPFQWGFRDCSTLALRFIDLATGLQLAAPVCGQYNSLETAVQFQKDYGRNIDEILKDAGAVEVKPGFEQTGDILTLAGKDFHFVQVIVGGRVLSAGPDHGVRMFDKNQIKAGYTAWRFLQCHRP